MAGKWKFRLMKIAVSLALRLRAYADTHHREVIVRLGARAEGLYLLLHRFYHLLGAFEVGTSQGSEQAIVAEPLLLGILSLVCFEECIGLFLAFFFSLFKLFRCLCSNQRGHTDEPYQTGNEDLDHRLNIIIQFFFLNKLASEGEGPGNGIAAPFLVITIGSQHERVASG